MTKQDDPQLEDGTDIGSEGKAGTRGVTKETLFNFERADGTEMEECTKAGRGADVEIPPRLKR